MTDPLPLADELVAVSARMAGVLLTRETVSSGLQLIVTLMGETLPTSSGAGVTLVDSKGRRTTAAASDELTERADALQYELDEGPCLAAWASRSVVRVDEMSTEGRWRRWCEAVAPLGLHSALSAPMLAGDGSLGAIKVYGRQGAFDEHAERVLTLFAAQAGVLVANLQTHEDAQRLSEGLRGALHSRDVIGQAKGILMNSRGLDEQGAFLELVAASQRQNRKLVDIAGDVVSATLRRRR